MPLRRVTRFLAIPFCVLMVGAGGLADVGVNDALTRAHAILAVLDAVGDACPTQCEYTICEALGLEYHANSTPTPPRQGSDAGEQHSCAVSLNGCADHLCMPGGEELPALELLLASLDGAALLELDAGHHALTYNAERRALQVAGCGGRVLLSIALAPSIAAGLTL